MKLSWESVKISIAGAKLTHLVQKDNMWDHGTMIELVKNIFFKVKRVKVSGNIEDLKKYFTQTCFEKFKNEMEELKKNGKIWVIKNILIKEAAVIKVNPGKNNRADSFTALIKSTGIEFIGDANTVIRGHSDRVQNSAEQWAFLRQRDWWLVDHVKSLRSY